MYIISHYHILVLFSESHGLDDNPSWAGGGPRARVCATLTETVLVTTNEQ